MTNTVQPQYVKYTFYQVDNAWRRLPTESRQQDKRELAAVLAEFAPPLMLRTYTLMGMRGDADLLVWCVSPDLEHIQALASAAAQTQMGTYLHTRHSYLAMTRRSTYIDEHEHEGSESRTRIRPMDRKYLFVYPFVKTHAWYQLPMEERQRLMSAHFKVGHLYPDVKIHTSYSFGLDDQEFVLGFEADDPSRFLELVMELRSAEQRPYTERDVPIFTCVRGSIDQVLDTLG
ncbi:MAG: chlorite dismutase family protein [Dehalococcoidia bacterium]